MSATAAPYARPAWAVTAWVDDVAVYVELPGSAGLPYITKYPLTEGGLSTALNLMRQAHHQASGGRRYTIPTDGVAKPSNVKSPAGTPSQRANALALLRKHKII